VSGQTLTFAVKTSDGPASGVLTAGQAGTVSFQATVAAQAAGTTSITASSSLTSNEVGPLTASVPVAILQPSLTLTKRASTSQLVPGDTVTYTLTLTNTGTGSATSPVLTDVLPET